MNIVTVIAGHDEERSTDNMRNEARESVERAGTTQHTGEK